MAAHRKLAADFGHQAEAVVRAARERLQHQEKPVNAIDRVRESLTFARDKNFEREAVVDERALIRDGLRRGMGEITYAQVRGNLDARLASGEFQIVDRSQSQPARQFTTAKTIAAEQEIVRRVGEGRNQVEPVLTRQQAIACCRPASASQPRPEERDRRCSEFSRPHPGHSGFRRRGQDNHAFRRP